MLDDNKIEDWVEAVISGASIDAENPTAKIRTKTEDVCTLTLFTDTDILKDTDVFKTRDNMMKTGMYGIPVVMYVEEWGNTRYKIRIERD